MRALLVPIYQVAKGCDEWNDPDSGSERALFTALDEVPAERSGRAEMKDAPWVLWGHSGGSSWSAQMITRHPQRGAAGLVSRRMPTSSSGVGRSFGAKFIETARDVLPLLFVWGKRESTTPSSHFVS